MGTLDGGFDTTQSEMKQLYDWLVATHSDPQVIKGFAMFAGLDLSTVYLERAAKPLWLDVLTTAGKQRKLRALVEQVRDDKNSAGGEGPPLMNRMLAEPADPLSEVAVAVAGVAQAIMDIADETFEAGLLRKDLPFIDRVELRGHLKLMTGPAQRRALLISGESGMGKTWTREFINYLVDEGGLPAPKSIDLSTRAGEPIDERELASRVAERLLKKEPPTFDPTAQADTVIDKFLDWLSAELEGIAAPIWLVLDGFVPKTASEGAMRLVGGLARRAALRDLGSIRVIVLGFSGDVALAGSALSEPLRAPTRDDLKTFFRRAAVELQETAPSDDALDALVTDFDSQCPIETTPLVSLGPQARQQAYDLFGG